MSEEGGRQFRSPKSVNEEDEAIQNAIPHQLVIRRSGQWKGFASGKLREDRQVMKVMAYRISIRQCPVGNFDAESLAYWLGKFVQEVVNKDGQRYPARTLYRLITGIK